MDRLKRQVDFIIEIDKLKHVYRQTILMDSSRRENDAEHSWHLGIMAVLLSEYAIDDNLDVLKVIKMVLIHDLVEIDAGDTFCYDDAGHVDKCEREQMAADRIFNILPEDQAKEFRAIWDEFEERRTPEAKFAAALDRMQPVLHNYITKGHTWQHSFVTKEKVYKRNQPIEDGAPRLWEYVKGIIDDAVEKGFLKEQ